MDVSTIDHSDSDSGDSWTLLENSPADGDGSPDIPENAAMPCKRDNIEVHSEKDEDTDGISIISDSDHDYAPCELNYVQFPIEETPSTQEENTPLLTPPVLTNIKHDDPVPEETDFLGDSVKFKTYVHKRSPKVGTILDIIMLGTFIITAGMALGHLWSCKNECTNQASVNKVLSNLYKLQEENAMLRNKLKELTQVTSYQIGQRKCGNGKPGNKHQRCKKIFEEPILQDNKEKSGLKCVDDIKFDLPQNNPSTLPDFERELLSDIDRMKDIYNENKSWLDAEVKSQYEEIVNSNDLSQAKPEQTTGQKSHRQINLERQLTPSDNVPIQAPPDLKLSFHHNKLNKQGKVKKQLGPTYFDVPLATDKNDDSKTQSKDPDSLSDAGSDHSFEMLPEKKITYADSLKIDPPMLKSLRADVNEIPYKQVKDHITKKRNKQNDNLLNLSAFSEEDIKKDDRYSGPKVKHDKKKHDRQKSHKKQKRQNKYQQWEMKGGYLKDFDEFSIASSLDNDGSINKPEKRFRNADLNNYINKLLNDDTEQGVPRIAVNLEDIPDEAEAGYLKREKGKKAKRNPGWFDKRSALRAEARKHLEHELFGESSPNNAAWYFRRMQKREQCRSQKDNSTFKKFSKQKMNFKMKR